MKYLKLIKVETEIKEVNYIQCDWCQNVYNDEKREAYIDSGIEINYRDIDAEFKLEYTVSQSSYPDWMGTVGFKVEDLCPTCAMNLKELMIEAGIKIIEIDL